MSQQTRETLKKYFEKNDTPTAGQFSDLIDSVINIEDNGFNTVLYPKGNWQSAVSYVYGDTVYLNGSTFYCLLAHTSNDLNIPPPFPLEENTWWKVLAKKGDEIMIQVTSTYIQWKYFNDITWQNLIALSNLKGADGINGINGTNGKDIELQKSATYIQWRYVGDINWIDLVALSTLKGADGYTPIKGVDYFDGTNGLDIVWKGAYDNAIAYVINDAVSYLGSSYICKLASTGNLPTNTTYWDLIAQRGNDGTGTGDMLKATYDPTNKNSDAFSMDNMAEGANTKIMTATERTNLANQSGINTGDENATSIKAKLGITTLSGSNTGDETAASIATIVTGAGAQTAPLDADEIPFYKIVGTVLSKVTWANIKATLKTYFDTLYSNYVLTKAAVEAVLTGVITSHSHTVTKADVGLSNVDNTSDSTKNAAVATLTNKTLTKPTINGSTPGIDAATDGATITFDCSTANIHSVTLGGNRTLALSNVSVGQVIMIELKQDAIGSRIPVWWSGISWAGGTPPTLTTTASKTDTFGFRCTGTGTYIGYIIGQNI